MRCASVREAVSASMDAEPVAIDLARIAAHLDSCAGCRQWQELAHVVTRRARLGQQLPASDLSARIVAGVAADVRRRRSRRHRLAFARGVVLVGLLQLLATVPLLVLAQDHTSGGGRLHALGGVEMAIGAGFFLSALVVLWRDRHQVSLELVTSDQPVTGAAAADSKRIGEVA